MDENIYPRLRALLEGRLSMYALEEWPRVRMELAQYDREVEALRQANATLADTVALLRSEGREK